MEDDVEKGGINVDETQCSALPRPRQTTVRPQRAPILPDPELPSGATTRAAVLVSTLRRRWLIPARRLPDALWTDRHRTVLVLLCVHVVGITGWAAVAGKPHVWAEIMAPVLLGLVGWRCSNRAIKSVSTSLGLFACSAIIVHLTGGVVEAHFHFFFVLAVISLYEDMVPYLAGIMFVLLEHFVVGLFAPEAVFGHDVDSLRWAMIHAGFVAGTSVVHVLSWSSHERSSRDRTRALTEEVTGLAAIVDGTGAAIFSSSLEGKIISWNPAATDVFGYEADMALGRPLTTLATAARVEEVLRDLDVAASGASLTYETVRRHRDGRPIDVLVTTSPVLNAAGVVSAASFVARDISDQKQAERELAIGRNELHRLAYIDPLTGLANRTRLMEVLDEKSCERGEGACLLVLDLDDFKAINDTAGHGVGDELLRSVADRLRRLVRAPDLVARLGGDEFAIVLRAGELDHGGRVAQRVVDELSTPHVSDSGVYLATASVGVAVAASGTSGEELLRDADVAMYAAKRAGRSGWVMFDHTMRQATVERVDLEHDLRGAVEAGELVLHLQPIVTVATGQVSSFEALVRWRHPLRGLVQPDCFIPLAEETGLIVGIGEWVLREACEQAKRLSGLAGRSVHVAVNVSPRQTAAGQGFVDTVVRCLDEAGLDPTQLTLEITETSLLEDRSASIPSLERLRELGIRISIDDFGTGQSSLARLRSLPVDELKIDRSFVAEIVNDVAGSPILAAIVTMARSLGLELVAEGVEDEEQLRAVAGLGCQNAQGYFFSRPLPAQEIEWLVTSDQPFTSAPAGSSGNSEQRTLAVAMQAIIDGASDASSAIRPLLAVLQSSTGFEAAYITTIDWEAGTQQIRYLYDTGISVLSEGLTVALEDSVCRPMLAGGPWATDDVARDYPTAGAAVAVGIGSYCGVPIYGPAGAIVGTLCVAGRGSVRHHAWTQQLMTTLSDIVAHHLTGVPDVRKHRPLAHR